MSTLDSTLAEVERHVHASGWDVGPALFALVRSARFAADDPGTARRLGLSGQDPDALVPVEQAELPDEPLDDLLAGIHWPDGVEGCAVSQEIVVLPPSAEAGLSDEDAATRAAAHPDRREARLVAGVLRDGSTAALLRLRSVDDLPDDIVTGTNLAPNLVAALLATLA